MRLDVLCPACGDASKVTIPAGCSPGTATGPTEWIAYTPGRALDGFKCDHCAEVIPRGSPAVVREVWSRLRPRLAGYLLEYLDPTGPTDAGGSTGGEP